MPQKSPRSKIRKKSRKGKKTLKNLNKLKDLAWLSVREAVYRRDGHQCQICHRKPPEIILNCDHWLSRKNSSTFFDINNLTTLCAAHNLMKFRHQKDIEQHVTEIVREREGDEVMMELRKKSWTPKKWTFEEIEQIIESANKLWPNQTSATT